MKKIIVATDFSPSAMNAVNYAADMASSIQADLILLHVYQVPVSYAEIPVAINLDDIQRNVEDELNKIREELNRKGSGKLTIETEVRVGTFFPELKTVCEIVKPYTVILGSQGKTAAERFLFGSHAIHAMKHLMWPLITVPPKASFSAIKKIGLACDFSDVVETTPVDEIKTLVNDFHARLHVLNTGKKEKYDPDAVFESGLLQELLSGLNPEFHIISSENTDEGIMEFADNNQIDLLLVLPRRHNLLDLVTHKSHTKQFVLHSHVPAMALHL